MRNVLHWILTAMCLLAAVGNAQVQDDITDLKVFGDARDGLRIDAVWDGNQMVGNQVVEPSYAWEMWSTSPCVFDKSVQGKSEIIRVKDPFHSKSIRFFCEGTYILMVGGVRSREVKLYAGEIDGTPLYLPDLRVVQQPDPVILLLEDEAPIIHTWNHSYPLLHILTPLNLPEYSEDKRGEKLVSMRSEGKKSFAQKIGWVSSDEPNLWPTGCVPVTLGGMLVKGNEKYDQEAVSDVIAALEQWNSTGVPIQLRAPRINKKGRVLERYVIVFEGVIDDSRNCGWSPLGNSRNLDNFNAGAHTIKVNLSEYCRDSVKRTVLHEMGHSAGLLHEHQRKDRDEYIKVKTFEGNKKERSEWDRAYGKINEKWILQFPYDHHSIMHYRTDEIADPQLMGTYRGDKDDVVWSLRFESGDVLETQLDTLSAVDIEKLQFLYRRVARNMARNGWSSPCDKYLKK